jgi:hypothetical protein
MNYGAASAFVSLVGILATNRWFALTCLVTALGLLIRGHFKDRA